MDFRKLIQELDSINEAGPDLDNAPKVNNVTQSAPGTDVYDQPNYPTGKPAAAQAASAPPQQDEVQKNNLIKQLADISTKLFNLTQQSIQNGTYESLGNIEYALLESFNLLFEGPIADQRAALVKQAQNIMKALGQFPQDERVQDAIARAQRSMQPPQKPADLTATQNTGASSQETKPVSTNTNKSPTAPAKSAPTYNFDPKVAAMQDALNKEGGEKLDPDGKLGPLTQAAMVKHPEITNRYFKNTGTAGNQPATAPTRTSGQNLDNVIDKTKAGYKSGGITGAISGMGGAVADNWRNKLGLDSNPSDSDSTKPASKTAHQKNARGSGNRSSTNSPSSNESLDSLLKSAYDLMRD